MGDVAADGVRARYPSAAYRRMRREETVRPQVGWYRGFIGIRPEAKIIFVRGFLFGSEGGSMYRFRMSGRRW